MNRKTILTNINDNNDVSLNDDDSYISDQENTPLEENQ